MDRWTLKWMDDKGSPGDLMRESKSTARPMKVFVFFLFVIKKIDLSIFVEE